MFREPQVEVIYPDGRKRLVAMEYEDGVVLSLYPNGKTTVTQSESARVPLYHQLMATMNDISHYDINL